MVLCSRVDLRNSWLVTEIVLVERARIAERSCWAIAQHLQNNDKVKATFSDFD